MRYFQHKTDFKDIGTVVFYTRNGKFFPEEYLRNKDESDPTPLPQLVLTEETKDVYLDSGSDKVLYCVSDSKLVDIDFAEYDFSYITEKAKFNNNLKLNYISQETKELIGKDKEDLKKIESAIFPTLISGEESSNVSYFSSTRIQNQTLYLLNVPKDIIKVELYEGAIETNWSNVIGFSDFINDTGDFLWPVYPRFIDYDLFKALSNGEDKDFITKPAITIYFGPSYYNGNNKDSSYYFPDNIQRNLNLTDSKSWLKEMDEIECSKVVWLLLASDSSISEINLAYDSWINNINPHRNKKHYTLRNDDYYSTRESLSVLEKYNWNNESGESELVFDATSGTILGTRKVDNGIESSKFLEKKLNKISNTYHSCINYSKGDIITIGEEQFISLCDNNLDNYPKISYQWAKKDEMDIFTHSINIYSNPPGAAIISPSTVTIRRFTSGSSVSINVIEYPGYKFKEISDVSNNGGNIIASTESTNTEILGKYNKIINITDLSSLETKNSLFFKFESTGIPIKIKGIDSRNGSIFGIVGYFDFYNDKNWFHGVETSEDNITWNTIVNNPSEIQHESDEDGIYVFSIPYIDIKSAGIKYIFSGLDIYSSTITKVYTTYFSVNEEEKTKYLDWNFNDGILSIQDPDIINYQMADLYIEVDNAPVSIIVYPDPHIEFSISSASISYGGRLEEFKFFIEDGYKIVNRADVDIDKNGIVFINRDTGEVECSMNDGNIIPDNATHSMIKELSGKITISRRPDIITAIELRKDSEGIYTITMNDVYRNYRIFVNVEKSNDN